VSPELTVLEIRRRLAEISKHDLDWRAVSKDTSAERKYRPDPTAENTASQKKGDVPQARAFFSPPSDRLRFVLASCHWLPPARNVGPRCSGWLGLALLVDGIDGRSPAADRNGQFFTMKPRW